MQSLFANSACANAAARAGQSEQISAGALGAIADKLLLTTDQQMNVTINNVAHHFRISHICPLESEIHFVHPDNQPSGFYFKEGNFIYYKSHLNTS